MPPIHPFAHQSIDRYNKTNREEHIGGRLESHMKATAKAFEQETGRRIGASAMILVFESAFSFVLLGAACPRSKI